MRQVILSDPDMGSESQSLPLVSVLVPAFNHQDYIECCLESVAESSYAPLEILVIDDGSSDDTYVRACTWMESNAHRVQRVEVRRQRNQGIVRTLNSLTALVHGEYVAVLASDDALEPAGIALRVSALQSHPEWLAVFGDSSVIDSVGNQEAASALVSRHHACIPALLNPRRIARELILRWSVPGSVMMARRIAFDVGTGVGPYDERLQVEDRDFYLRLLSINALGFVPVCVARYRLHGANSILVRGSIVRRDVVLAEWRNISAFRGLNRWLLALVALRGRAALRAADQKGRGHRVRGQILGVVGDTLEFALRFAHLINRFLSPPRGA
jgi:glycosyltransferase involved in cell wall biosynthesis